MLEFILGRPKSGKTTEIINRIKVCIEDGKRTYLIVPEQQAHISETMIATVMPQAARYLKVISFSSISELVASKHGGLTRKPVSDAVKHLLVWHSANAVADQLNEFRGNRNDTSFSDMILSTVTELAAYGISPEDLAQKINSKKSTDEAFKNKFNDIALIYAAFEHDVKEKLGGDIMLKEELQRLLADKLAEFDFFRGTQVFIDSFTDFTSSEEEIIKKIIRQAEKITVAMNLPHRDYDQNHTKSISRTVKELCEYAEANGIETKAEPVAFGCDTRKPVLAELEARIWDFSLKPEERRDFSSEDLEAIKLTFCRNAYEEAEYVAIKLLEEKNSGTSFSNMAVIMRDAEKYKGIINAVFNKYNIPYFYSEKTNICSTSASRFILSSLRAIATGFRLDDVLTLVKTGLCPITDEECDMFEDYCTTWNINGKGFTVEAFNMNPDGYTVERSERADTILAAANKVKDTIIPPLERLYAAMHSAPNTRESMRALYRYIDETHLADSISELCEYELDRGNVRECSDTLRIYDYIIESIQTVARLFDDEKLKLGEIIKAIEIMFTHTDIASVPPIDDYVTIGSASTLRTENIKIAFVMGLCEGEFPRAVGDTSLIKREDRKILSELDRDYRRFAVINEKLSCDELYFVYSALTTPSEKLYITCPTAGIDGKAKAPSVAWSRILFIFKIDEETVETFDLSRIKPYVRDGLLASSDTDSVAADMYEVDPMQARLIFGDRIRLSKSQISTFTLCPYRYWCENVLSLREPKSSEIDFANIGTIIHHIIENYLKENTTNGNVDHKEPEYILERATEITEKYIEDVGVTPPPSVLYAISRFRNTAFYMLRSIDEEFQHNDFKILCAEEKIGEGEKSRLKPLYISVPVSEDFSPTVILGGKVDRIDTFTTDSGIYLRIVDYKTGKDTFNIDKISDGHDIQLPIYLFAATADINQDSSLFAEISGEKEKRIIPASALFLSVREKNGMIEPFRSGFILNDSELLKATNHSLDDKFIVGTTKTKNEDKSPRNHVSEEQMAEIKDTLCETISNIAKDIYSGKAPRRPSSDACGFCKLKNQCPVAVKDKFF